MAARHLLAATGAAAAARPAAAAGIAAASAARLTAASAASAAAVAAVRPAASTTTTAAAAAASAAATRAVSARGVSQLSSNVLSTPPTKVTTLDNGVRVATEENHGGTATVGVYIDAGSAFESAENNGTAHFLEHLAFKGTENRSRQQLEEEVENMGATLNAYTAREQTVYYAQAFKDHVPQAMDLLSDIVLRSTFDEAAVEAERAVILREAEEVAKDVFETTFDRLHAAAYQGTPLGRTILGSTENVSTITRDDLLAYTKRFYRAPRIVVAGAGAVRHEELVELAQNQFGGLPAEDDPANAEAAAAAARPSFTGSWYVERDDVPKDLHVAIAVEGVGLDHPDFYALQLMQALAGTWNDQLGSGNNIASQLCEIVATEGLAKQITSFNTCYKESGLFGAYAVTGEHQVEDLLFEITNEWLRLAHNPTAAEIERAKTKLKHGTLMALDGSFSVCEDIGRQMLSVGRRLTPAQIFAHIDAITPADLMRVARHHCEDVCPVVVATGPTGHLPSNDLVRGFTVKNRF